MIFFPQKVSLFISFYLVFVLCRFPSFLTVVLVVVVIFLWSFQPMEPLTFRIPISYDFHSYFRTNVSCIVPHWMMGYCISIPHHIIQSPLLFIRRANINRLWFVWYSAFFLSRNRKNDGVFCTMWWIRGYYTGACITIYFYGNPFWCVSQFSHWMRNKIFFSPF